MNVLIGCESSGVTREAFRALGHNAWSCDLLPADDGSPYHFQCDIEERLNDGRDFALFHLPCTWFTNAGVRWLFEGGKSNGRKLTAETRDETRWRLMKRAEAQWHRCQAAPIPKMVFENPIPHPYVNLGTWPRQVIQPWHHGEPEFKATCLWRKGVEPLKETNRLVPPKSGTPEHKEWSKVFLASPGPDRWKIRSRTLDGVGAAYARQWGRVEAIAT